MMRETRSTPLSTGQGAPTATAQRTTTSNETQNGIQSTYPDTPGAENNGRDVQT